MVEIHEGLRVPVLAIREGRLGDEEKFADLYRADGLDRKSLNDRNIGGRRYLLEVANGKRKVFFAFSSGVVSGTVQLSFESSHRFGDDVSTAELHYLKVRRSFVGRGVASELNRRLEQEARVRGIKRLILDVRTNNHRAIAIYRRWGYSIKKPNLGTQFPTYTMSKRLDAPVPS